jgi:SAM-dependent methyltransferase
VTDFFKYDFGYTWPWLYGHLIAAIVFLLIATLAWRLAWSRWTVVLAGVAAVWALAGFAVFGAPLNRPATLPTARFLESGSGRVLDGGAGSGRATVMVLLARPRATVVALDLFSEGYGIRGNAPDRLRANVRAAGAENRLEVQAGDLRKLPFEAGSFDAAVSTYAIDHLGRKGEPQALAEMSRVLRPNGQFLLMVVNNDGWVRFAYPLFYVHTYFHGSGGAAKWRSLLDAAGFDIVEEGTQPGTLYFLAQKRAYQALTSALERIPC